MKLIEQLTNIGFDFTQAPEPLKNALRVLNGYTGQSNGKLDLLDNKLFFKLAQLFPEDSAILQVKSAWEKENAHVFNDGFNSLSNDDDDIAIAANPSIRSSNPDSRHTHATDLTLTNSHDSHPTSHTATTLRMNNDVHSDLKQSVDHKRSDEAAQIINKALEEVQSLQKPAFLQAITPSNKIDTKPAEFISQVNPQVGSLRPNFLKNALLGYDEI
ncbi:hypothetical protein ACFPQ1_21315, partial [Rhodocytophaga aerolata]